MLFGEVMSVKEKARQRDHYYSWTCNRLVIEQQRNEEDNNGKMVNLFEQRKRRSGLNCAWN